MTDQYPAGRWYQRTGQWAMPQPQCKQCQAMGIPPPSKITEKRRNERENEGEEEKSSPPRALSAISINFCESTPLLWRAADVREVREMGLIGTLVGSLPRQPRQNCRLGRPLQLMQEEGRLLTEMGKVALMPARDVGEGGEMHQELVEQYEAGQERSFEEQSVLALEDRKASLLRAMTDQQKDGESGSGTPNKTLADRLEALERGFTFPRSALAVQLCTAKAGLAYCAEEQGFLAASWPTGSQGDLSSETRFRVFRDLRRRGFYLTSAGKFGGDYLVYPGDPLRFHAHFIAVCLPMDEPMSLCDVLAIARLGSNVKKTVLLCSPGPGQREDTEEVVYTSLQWSGMV